MNLFYLSEVTISKRRSSIQVFTLYIQYYYVQLKIRGPLFFFEHLESREESHLLIVPIRIIWFEDASGYLLLN